MGDFIIALLGYGLTLWFAATGASCVVTAYREVGKPDHLCDEEKAGRRIWLGAVFFGLALGLAVMTRGLLSVGAH